MAKKQKKGAGGKLSRSEVVTVRLDPRLRYGLELAARKHRRTASSFIEWSVERALAEVLVYESDQEQFNETVEHVLEKTWDVDEADRLIRLAFKYPDLLTHDEQVVWKLVRECGAFWQGEYVESDGVESWTWKIEETCAKFALIREHFATLRDIAAGERPMTDLPVAPPARATGLAGKRK